MNNLNLFTKIPSIGQIRSHMQTLQRGAFSPLDDVGTTLWWDPSITSSISHTLNQIDQINDLSGNNKHGTSSLTNRPLTNTMIVNGMNYIKNDGSNDHLSCPSIDFATTDEMTIYTVVRKLADHGGGYSGIVSVSPTVESLSGSWYQLFESDNSRPVGGEGNIGFGSNSPSMGTRDSGQTLANDVTKVITVQTSKNNNSSRIWINSTEVASGNDDATLVSSPIHFGRLGLAAFNGGIGEVIVNNQIISDERVLETISYLMSRWV